MEVRRPAADPGHSATAASIDIQLAFSHSRSTPLNERRGGDHDRPGTDVAQSVTVPSHRPECAETRARLALARSATVRSVVTTARLQTREASACSDRMPTIWHAKRRIRRAPRPVARRLPSLRTISIHVACFSPVATRHRRSRRYHTSSPCRRPTRKRTTRYGRSRRYRPNDKRASAPTPKGDCSRLRRAPAVARSAGYARVVFPSKFLARDVDPAPRICAQ